MIYEFYNVVKYLAFQLILAEVFINVEVVRGQSKVRTKLVSRSP